MGGPIGWVQLQGMTIHNQCKFCRNTHNDTQILTNSQCIVWGTLCCLCCLCLASEHGTVVGKWTWPWCLEWNRMIMMDEQRNPIVQWLHLRQWLFQMNNWTVLQGHKPRTQNPIAPLLNLVSDTRLPQYFTKLYITLLLHKSRQQWTMVLEHTLFVYLSLQWAWTVAMNLSCWAFSSLPLLYTVNQYTVSVILQNIAGMLEWLWIYQLVVAKLPYILLLRTLRTAFNRLHINHKCSWLQPIQSTPIST